MMSAAPPASGLGRRLRMAGYVLAGLLLLAGAAHGFVWWRVTGALIDESARWVAARNAEGLVARHGPPQRGGWPFAARVRLPQVAMMDGSPRGGLTLASDAIVLQIALLRPRELEVRQEGRFSFGGSVPAATFDAQGGAEDFRVRVPLLARGDGAASHLAIRGLVLETATERLAVERLDAVVTHNPNATGEVPSAGLVLTALGIELPPSAGAALGSRISRAALDLDLIGRFPPGGSAQAQAIAWRDAGGFIQVPRLLLEWGALSLSADATLALDAAAQPSGAGRARISGLLPTLEALAARGLVPPSTVQAARAILPFLQRSQSGGPPVIDLPLSLYNRTLSAGRFTLLQLPPLVLPR